MTRKKSDQELGMGRTISRRDFVNGVAATVGALAISDWADVEGSSTPGIAASYYPPSLTGMRGNHDGSFTLAHELRDGDFWDSAHKPTPTGEAYDLVVVGAGISGLSAAYFYRKHAGPKAKILILDNHDDFGGHARRNEFRSGTRLLLANAGTQSIESPGKYSSVAKQLLADLGIDVQKFYKTYDQTFYAANKLGNGCFFDRETFGEDRLLTGLGSARWPEFFAKAPLSDVVRNDLIRVYTEKKDYLAGMTVEQKRAKLAKISYADFLTSICGVHPDALRFFQSYTNDLFTVGIDAVSALSCFENPDDYGGYAYAGFEGLGLGADPEKEEPYIFHFPDGNASIARLLVRALIPMAVPGHTMEDVVTSRVNYGVLSANGPTRILLNSTVARARNIAATGSAHEKEVEVAYINQGKLHSVKAKNCVLACYNTMIPYLCPELPEKQKEGLSYLVKAPLVYTHVAVKNWTAFHKLGVRQIEAPGSYHTYVSLDFPVSMGDYKFANTPEEPTVLFMLRTPCKAGLPIRDQHRAGRAELMRTPFSTFERNIRDQLGRMLGSAGFDPARDIEGITVNRWAHGYAYTPSTLWDPDWKTEEETPWFIGRQRFGRIAIANSDAGASAYTDVAIDQAYRAVQELIG